MVPERRIRNPCVVNLIVERLKGSARLGKRGAFPLFPIMIGMIVSGTLSGQFAPDPSIGKNLPDSIPEAAPDAYVRRPSELEIKPDYADVPVTGVPGSGVLRELDFSGALSPKDRRPGHALFPDLHVDRVDLLASKRGFLVALRKEFIGKPLDMETVKKICQKTLHFYFHHERPLVFVQPVSIDYEHGVLSLEVVEATLDGKTGTGARWFSQKLLLSLLQARNGQHINRMGLLNDVAILNQNPFMQNSAIFRRGTVPGTTALDLCTQDSFPLRAFFSVDNTGSQQTGPLRWSAGANWGNAFFLGGQLSYQYSAPFAYPNSQPVQSLSYSTPLPWKHLFAIYASYSTTDTSIDAGAAGSIPYRGYQAQVSPRYTIPIAKMYGNLIQNLTLGGDWKSSNLYFLQGGDQVPSNQTDVIQSVFGYEVQRTDSLGVTSAGANLYWAPGNIDSRNTDQAFQYVDPRTQSDYLYSTLRLRRDTLLPWGCSLMGLFTGQVASSTLPSTEQFSIGGYGSVRGYQQQILFGDQGFFFNLELHSPGYSLLGWTRSMVRTGGSRAAEDLKKSGSDQLQFLAFWDYGYTDTIHPLPGNAASYAITGAGVGMRYGIGNNTSLRCDLGFPLINPQVQTQNGPTLALGASVGF